MNHRGGGSNDRYGKGAETPMIGAQTPAYGSGGGVTGCVSISGVIDSTQTHLPPQS